MKHKKRVKSRKLKYTNIGVGILLTCAFSSTATAQTMNVNESSGAYTAYALDDIQKMSFSSGNVIVTETDNSSSEYALGALQHLTFEELVTSMEERTATDKPSLHTYPNPVSNELTVDISGMSDANGTLRILNLEGRVMKTHKVHVAERLSVDMSQFPLGIYLCQYSNGTEVKTVKIIKQ